MLLASLFRATPENPRFSLDDPDAWDAFGSSQASSGVSVNYQTALTYSPWWRGINLISRDVAKIPLYLYHRTDRGKQRATDHPAYYLLRWKPNEIQNAVTFRSQLTGHALATGNGYAYIVRAGDGSPIEFIPLDPNSTWPVRANKVLWYVTQVGGEQRKIRPEDMIHVKGYGWDGLCGYSVIDKARESLGLGLGAHRFATIFFRNSARPSVILEHPNKMSETAKIELRESWERMQGGLDNSHRTAVLDQGLKANPLSFNAEDSQLIETRQFEIREVANWLGIPPHKVGDTTRTAFASLEQENQSYLDDALEFWLCNWEMELREKALTERQKHRDTHFVEFQRRAMVKANLDARTKYYSTALLNGWMSRDEIREEEGMNPIADGEGGRYFVPLNVTLTKASGVGEDEEESAGAAAAGAGGVELLAVPDVRQQQAFDCGAASTLAVCQFFEKGPTVLEDLTQQLGTNATGGTRPESIVGLLARAGLAVTIGTSLTVDNLAVAFEQGRPVICPVQALAPADGSAPTGNNNGHYVVVIGVGLGQVFVQDPATGPRMMAAEAFDAAWHDVDADGVSYDHFGIMVGLEVPGREEDEEAPDDPAPDPTPAPAPAAADPDPAQRAALLAAQRAIAEDTVSRMVRRLGVHARKAAGKPGEFLAWLDTMSSDHRGVIAEAIGPVADASRSLGVGTESGETLASRLIETLHRSMLALSGQCKSAEIAQRVDVFMADMEATLPVAMARELFPEV